MLYDALVTALREELPDLQAIYLFGSRGRGEEHAGSDVDVAVLGPRPIDPVGRWELQERLAVLVHAPVDLVDLRAASTVMRVQVLDGSTLLFEADAPARALFEATALGAYARLEEERRGILDDVHRTGHVYR